MDSRILISLMRFFAFLLQTDAKINLKVAKSIVLSFLQKQFDETITKKYTAIFEDHFLRMKNINPELNEASEEELIAIINSLKSLPLTQRIFLLINTVSFNKYLQYLNQDLQHNASIAKITNAIAVGFNINNKLQKDIEHFVFGRFDSIHEEKDLLIVTGLKLQTSSAIKKHIVAGLKAQIYVLKIKTDNFLISIRGKQQLLLNNRLMLADNVYIASYHTNIKTVDGINIHYNDLLKVFLQGADYPRLSLKVHQLTHKFAPKRIGIQPISFQAETGEMIGIIGSSGVGKSTLLKLLCGIIPSHGGEIYYGKTNLADLVSTPNDTLGFIPQEESIFEDLTVYQNVLYQAKLCINQDEATLIPNINKTLHDLGLYELKDTKVGTPQKKILSGGQRKRLNIAIELVRNPTVIMIDEPTSGLSSSDAERIIQLLKQQSIKGKLILINLHQPSDQIFNLFDKLIVLDKGGYPVYHGHPSEAYEFLASKSQRISNPAFGKAYAESDKILNLLEETTIDAQGNLTDKRKTSPQEWYKYLNKLKKKEIQIDSKVINEVSTKTSITKNLRPSYWRQLSVYLKRNILSRIANKSYVVISILVAPLLATMLALFCKQYVLSIDGSSHYSFFKNENIPSFILMSIVVSLFVGLMTSAEEIIKDHNILKKEEFLKLSANSYLSSKIVFLFTLSLLQTFLYTSISFIILEFATGFLLFWLTLFSISLFANVCGLIISNLFSSVVSVYIVIPFIIIPQILLCGMVIQFDNIHPFFSSKAYTPIISDLMPTRWAYESIMVDQFKNNAYQSHFFEVDKMLSEVNYKLLAVIPYIDENLNNSDQKQKNSTLKSVMADFALLRSDDAQLNKNKAFSKLNNWRTNLLKKRNQIVRQKDETTKELLSTFENTEQFIRFKESNANETISETLLQKNIFAPYVIYKQKLIQKTAPIYHNPSSNWGRSHLYAPNKKIGGLLFNTEIFNTYVINLYTLLLLLVAKMLFKHKYKLA